MRGSEMIPGLVGEAETVVREEDVVSRWGGEITVDVLSTPKLIQLMEESAIHAIRDFIPPDQLCLGTEVRIKHISPTPLGMKVTAHALLKKVDKNRLFFLVDAYDGVEKVAEGEHERILLSREKFLQKVEKKKKS